MSATLQFEDVHEFPAYGLYLTPNEEVQAWRNLVKGLHIKRAAGICSSGEVGLFAMLPTVREELVLVDHSYASLHVAMVKYLLLQQYGPKETLRLLTTKGESTEFRKALAKVEKLLPEKVAKHNEKPKWETTRYGPLTKEQVHARYGVRAISNFLTDPWTQNYDKPEGKQLMPEIVREWDRLPRRSVHHCATKLDKVKFLHGDMADLVERGPFDLLYLSNALGHRSQNRRAQPPDFKEIAKSVRPGGYVILALSQYRTRGEKQEFTDAGWKELGSAASNSSIRWTQVLYQLPQEVAA